MRESLYEFKPLNILRLFFNYVLLQFKNVINLFQKIEEDPITNYLDDIQIQVLNILHEKIKLKVESEKNKSISELAAQVSHDIRSPLAALNLTISQLTNIPEQQRIILRSVSNRINDIANSMLHQSKNQIISSVVNVNDSSYAKKHEYLPAIVDSIISEKRVQYRDKIQLEIEADYNEAINIFVNVDAIELSRVLSNIINNSIEAMCDYAGKFKLTLIKRNNFVEIISNDNGRGIPNEIIRNLCQRGFSYGKNGSQSGSGLGLFHAKNTVESFGGSLDIESIEGKGTTITIKLPMVKPPVWFVEKITLFRYSTVVCLDDDNSIHHIWSSRFGQYRQTDEIKLLMFTSVSEFKKWVSTQPQCTSILYLIDYELINQKENGIDIVEQLNIIKQSILVTSRFDELKIQKRCENIGLKLIPKSLAGVVQIEVISKMLDTILIDDDELIGNMWTFIAKSKNEYFRWFKDLDSFLLISDCIDQKSNIYIDVSLGAGRSGQEVAYDLHQLGFENIHLCTGYDLHNLFVPEIIKSVINKECPF